MPYRSEDLTRLVQVDHTDAVRALEDGTAGAMVGRSDGQFDELARATLAGWVKAFGAASAVAVAGLALDRLVAAVRSAVRRLLDQLGSQSRNALRNALPKALALGVEQGLDFLHAASGRRPTVRTPRVPKALADEAFRIVGLVADHRERALTLLSRGGVSRWSDLLHAIGVGRSAGSAVRAHTAWTIGRAVNQGLDAVTKAVGLTRLWVSEANACVRCLAYTGLIAPTGRVFKGGLSWDPKQRRIGAPGIDGPPLHPHCRCRAVPWSGRWRGDSVPFPLALQREAHRSIAYGRALPTESRAARLRAARELLRAEPDLLPAVESTARSSVRNGRFPAAA